MFIHFVNGSTSYSQELVSGHTEPACGKAVLFQYVSNIYATYKSFHSRLQN